MVERVAVERGARVIEGQPLVEVAVGRRVVRVLARSSGRVLEVCVGAGDAVTPGAALVRLEPAPPLVPPAGVGAAIVHEPVRTAEPAPPRGR